MRDGAESVGAAWDAYDAARRAERAHVRRCADPDCATCARLMGELRAAYRRVLCPTHHAEAHGLLRAREAA